MQVLILVFILSVVCFVAGYLYCGNEAEVGGRTLYGPDDGRFRVGHNNPPLYAYADRKRGLYIALRWGLVMRPIPRIRMTPKFPCFEKLNPWGHDGRPGHWFVIRFPFVLPFISFQLDDSVFYVGGKVVRLNDPDYHFWARRTDMGVGKHCLAPSVRLSIRTGGD